LGVVEVQVVLMQMFLEVQAHRDTKVETKLNLEQVLRLTELEAEVLRLQVVILQVA